MKSLLLLPSMLLAIAIEQPVVAQDEKREKNIQSEQIIIQKDGKENEKITIQVDGDQVTVNGKPWNDFNNEHVKVKRKKMMIISDGNNIIFKGNPEELGDDDHANQGGNIKRKAFLGVVTEKDEKGATITAITPGSAAERAGLKEDDVITEVNDKKIEGPQSLMESIGQFNPDDEITIKYRREGKNKSIKLKLGAREEEVTIRNFKLGEDDMQTFVFPPIIGGDGPDLPTMPDLSDLGIQIQPSKKQKIGLKIQDTENGKGVKILELEEGSPGANSGLKKDDIIVNINGRDIKNTDDARVELKDSEQTESYRIEAERSGKIMEFDIRIPKPLKTINL